MSEASEEAATEGFTAVINRVCNALDVARRELASQTNEENLLQVTRRTFRRRRRARPMTGNTFVLPPLANVFVSKPIVNTVS